ncbi:hypothetical protein MAHJHV27_32380 [Mycobacterium avium subsp. hominissuis]
MKLNRFGAVLSVLSAGALVLSGCGSDNNGAGAGAGGSSSSKVSCGGKKALKASGSTAQANAMTRFVNAFAERRNTPRRRRQKPAATPNRRGMTAKRSEGVTDRPAAGGRSARRAEPHRGALAPNRLTLKPFPEAAGAAPSPVRTARDRR